jgi:hypothetical protein
MHTRRAGHVVARPLNCGVMRRVSLFVASMAGALLTACSSAVVCNVPSLESTLPSETIKETGHGLLFSPRCATSVAAEQEFPRAYGTIRARWWGSPHRLYVVARAHDGTPLTIRGPRVEDYSANRARSPVAQFDHRITFQVNDFDVNPSSETFAFEVFGDANEPIERLEMTYIPQRCTCTDYDSL